ncbi:hypothetical protein DI005_33510 [Prauserella sp. PE36]|nr:hypothetical protein DI005_33510 [Prauserella sp. PE36]
MVAVRGLARPAREAHLPAHEHAAGVREGRQPGAGAVPAEADGPQPRRRDLHGRRVDAGGGEVRGEDAVGAQRGGVGFEVPGVIPSAATVPTPPASATAVTSSGEAIGPRGEPAGSGPAPPVR